MLRWFIIQGLLMTLATADVRDFFPGKLATVRLDKDGSAYVIGQRGARADLKPRDHQFQSTPDLADVKEVVAGYDTIWFLKHNGEVWFLGVDVSAYAAETAKGYLDTHKLDEKRPELFTATPKKFPLPPMRSLTGTKSRIGGITTDGKVMAWGQTGDFGSDHSFVQGRVLELPAKPRTVTFAEYEQIILESEEGDVWGRGFIEDMRRNGIGAPWAKIPLSPGERIVAIGKDRLVSRSSGDLSEIRIHDWRRDLGEKDDRTNVIRKTFSVKLPASDSGRGTFTVEEDRIVLLTSGKIFDLGFTHVPGTWSERKLPEPVTRYWSGFDKSFYEGASGAFYASGKNTIGELGFPVTFTAPTEVPGLKEIVSITAESASNLAVDRAGRTYSWGSGQKLGDPSENRLVPTPVKVPPLRKVILGEGAALGLTLSGDVYLWGQGHYYVPPGFRNLLEKTGSKLRGKKEPDRRFPTKITELSGIADIAIPRIEPYKLSATATDKSGTVWGWTRADLSNQLLEPIFPSFQPPFRWKKLSADDREKFDLAGTEITWKKNGRLVGEDGLSAIPPVKDAKQVSIRKETHALALLLSDHRLGLLSGNGFRIVEENVHAIAEGNAGSLLVLKNSGELFFETWDDRTLAYKFAETEVPQIVEMASGGHHFLIRKTDGTVWAWGNNDSNQLGLPDTGSASTPRKLPPFKGQ